MLVCDATYDEELAKSITHGFSISALRVLKCNSSDPDYCIYIPFPLYKDEAIIDALLACDEFLSVGKWMKKEANSTVLVAMIVFLAKPLWDTIYKEVLEKQVKRLINRIKKLWPENTQLNCRVEVPTKMYQPRPTLHYLPPANEGIEIIAEVPGAVDAAKEFCDDDFKRFGKRIRSLNMTQDQTSRLFIVLNVEYIDGSHKSYS